MSDPQIVIKFDGGISSRHLIDMKLLGYSLNGFERIISDGIILLSENRLPRKNERAPITIYAEEPKRGSWELCAFLHDTSGMFPLGWQIISVTNGKIILDWVSFVLKFFGGRKSEAQAHLDAMIRMREIDEAGRAASDEKWHAQMGAWRDQTLALLEKLAIPSRQAVAPVGPSANSVGFSSSESYALFVDVPMADAIRTRGKLEVGDLEKITLSVDGYTHHNKTLKIGRPDELGKFMSADVRDPNFEISPNHYTQAAESKRSITVMAKLAYRDGHIHRIYIMEFISFA